MEILGPSLLVIGGLLVGRFLSGNQKENTGVGVSQAQARPHSTPSQQTRNEKTDETPKSTQGPEKPVDSPVGYHNYKIYGHPNRALAYRYGIANKRPDGSQRNFLRLRKLKARGNNEWLCELIDFEFARVIAVIKEGETYVSTFVSVGHGSQAVNDGLKFIEGQLPGRGKYESLDRWVIYGQAVRSLTLENQE